MIKNKIKISLPIHLKLSVLGLLIAVFSLALFGGINYANAVSALTFTDNAWVKIDGNYYVIKALSEATSVEINTANTQLTVVIPDTKTFTLISTDGYTLTNDQNIAIVCAGGESSVTDTATGIVTIIFTPTTVESCSSGSTGGSGGSVDTTAPTSTSVSISAGATTTTSTSVTLTLAATGASHMMIANTSAFTGASWETYATSKAWTLAIGDGTKTVYAKFKDTAGNISTAVSDTITLSATAAVVTTLPAGCLTGDVFSATTGLSCAVVATTTTTTTLPAGCVTGDLFSATSGLSCAVTTTTTPVVVPGCTTGDLFSATSGASCGTTATTTTTTTTTPATTTTTPATTTTTPTTSVVKFTKSITTKSLKADIKNLQTALNEVAGTSLVVDGMWGPKTTAAVKKFQTANSLVADGMFGPKSLAKMNTLLGL